MKTIEVKVKVQANGVMEANLMRDALQNIHDEMHSNRDFLLELSDKKAARDYAGKINSLINNPMVKMLAGKL